MQGCRKGIGFFLTSFGGTCIDFLGRRILRVLMENGSLDYGVCERLIDSRRDFDETLRAEYCVRDFEWS